MAGNDYFGRPDQLRKVVVCAWPLFSYNHGRMLKKFFAPIITWYLATLKSGGYPLIALLMAIVLAVIIAWIVTQLRRRSNDG